MSCIFKITENKGSHARDHFANERTYAAWLRTSLAFFGAGVVVIKLNLFKNVGSLIIGIILSILGILILFSQTLRYYHVLYLINTERFLPEKLIILIVSILTILIMLTFIILLIIFQ